MHVHKKAKKIKKKAEFGNQGDVHPVWPLFWPYLRPYENANLRCIFTKKQKKTRKKRNSVITVTYTLFKPPFDPMSARMKITLLFVAVSQKSRKMKQKTEIRKSGSNTPCLIPLLILPWTLCEPYFLVQFHKQAKNLKQKTGFGNHGEIHPVGPPF